VQSCITSPPYFGLRDYGVDGQIGLEISPAEFVAVMVEVFREVRRVLRNDGTLWLNLGDSYANDGKWGGHTGAKHVKALHCSPIGRNKKYTGMKAKDLMGIPWRVAFALQDDGWYLRQDIIWSKPNPMPESVQDRCTKAHEYLFLLSKSERYYFDAAAIAEPLAASSVGRLAQDIAGQQGSARVPGKTNGTMKAVAAGDTRNKRSVWTVATQPFKEAHFATFPPELIEPCVLAGSPAGGLVLDPFGGAGTTGLVADRLQRDAVLIELNPEYASLARKRITADAPLLAAS
jgi:DNA modification methylase